MTHTHLDDNPCVEHDGKDKAVQEEVQEPSPQEGGLCVDWSRESFDCHDPFKDAELVDCPC